MRALALLFSLLAFTSAYGAESRYKLSSKDAKLKTAVKRTCVEKRKAKLVGCIDNVFIVKDGSKYIVKQGDKGTCSVLLRR